MIGENNISRLDAFSAYSIPDRKLYVYLKIACVYLSCQNVKMGSVFRNYALLVDQPWLQFVAAMKQG